MSKPAALGAVVVDTLTAESVSEIAKEYVEIGLDAVLADGILKDIPIVNTILAIGKFGIGIHDRLFVKKLLSFLSGFQGVTAQDRLEMVRKLEVDPAYGRKVGEHVIELLDRIESHLKPGMVARAFKAYADSKVDVAMLHRLNSSIERIPVFEVPNVRKFIEAHREGRLGLSATSLQAMANAGLATGSSSVADIVYEPNDVCASFVSLELDRVQS